MKRLRSFVVITVSLLIASCFLFFSPSQKEEKTKKKKTTHHPSSKEWQNVFLQKISANPPPQWMQNQINTDLVSFSVITPQMLDTVMDESKANGQLVRYHIKDKKLFIDDTSHIVLLKRLEMLNQSLSDLVEIVALPDVDFIVSLHDAIDHLTLNGPVFAFAKRIDSNKIVLLPDFEALSESSSRLLGEVEEGIKKFPWPEKSSLGYWRGVTTGGSSTITSQEDFLSLPRTRAVVISIQQPTLIDARFTQLVQCSNEELQKKFSEYFVGKMTRIKDHLKYKYQLLIDGNTCAYSRAYWQLFSNCVILKQISPNIQWYYSLLSPYVHYIPLQNDLSDLAEKIQWAKNHDEDVRRIIENAQTLARENLKQADCYYYVYLLLQEYAKRQSTRLALT